MCALDVDCLTEVHILSSMISKFCNEIIIVDYFVPAGGPTAFGGRMSPDGSSLGTVESVEGIECSSSGDQSFHSGNDSSDGEDHSVNRRIGMQIERDVRKAANQEFYQKGELEEFLSADLDENPTMWLGTQDG